MTIPIKKSRMMMMMAEGGAPSHLTEGDRMEFSQAKKYWTWISSVIESCYSCTAKTVVAGIGGDSESVRLFAFIPLHRRTIRIYAHMEKRQLEFGKVGALFAGMECAKEEAAYSFASSPSNGY
ncbi:hypothetical protein V8E55_001466 [Tylopilus felleus]